jgi:hypothetical protein
MLTTSSPFGERSRGNRWGVVVGAHLIGGAAGGALLGATFGTIGWLIARVVAREVAVGVLVAVALIGLLADARIGGLRVPGPHRQVPERWRYEYRGWVYGSAYGFLLGIAFYTIVPSSATYVVFAGAAATGSLGAGALVGAVFGVARGTALLSTARVRDPGGLRTLLAAVQRHARSADRLTRAAQAALAVGALAFVVSGAG